eukprot:jgi/Botrbrau1/377/Bobra.110_2s0032.1
MFLVLIASSKLSRMLASKLYAAARPFVPVETRQHSFQRSVTFARAVSIPVMEARAPSQTLLEPSLQTSTSGTAVGLRVDEDREVVVRWLDDLLESLGTESLEDPAGVLALEGGLRQAVEGTNFAGLPSAPEDRES